MLLRTLCTALGDEPQTVRSKHLKNGYVYRRMGWLFEKYMAKGDSIEPPERHATRCRGRIENSRPWSYWYKCVLLSDLIRYTHVLYYVDVMDLLMLRC